jgi:hypothetical protein
MDAYKLSTGDDRDIVKAKRAENRRAAQGKQLLLFNQDGMEALSACALDLDAMPEENLEQVSEKRAAWQRIRNSEDCLKEHLKADLFTAAFFAAKTEKNRDIIPTSADLARINQDMQLSPELTEEINKLAKENSFFHWHLEFPEVFALEKGGFDVVLGNPPWEVSQLSEEEFFASRAPNVSELAGAQRKKAIANLKYESPFLWDEYQKEMHICEAKNKFYRFSGRFPLTAKGKINLYALFAEHFLRCLNPKGHAGIIVPTGIATDDSTKAYFDELGSKNHLASLFDFENREKLFPAVDSRMKFTLLTLSNNIPEAVFLFFATRTEHLQDNRRRFLLTADEIALLNPNTRTCPTFRSQADAELTKKLYRHAGVFINEGTGKSGNAWNVDFRQGLFNMTSDSDLFLTHAQLVAESGIRDGADWLLPDRRRFVPVYEAKFVSFFDHRAGSYETRGADRGYRVLPSTDLANYQNPNYVITPHYWVESTVVESRLSERHWSHDWLLGWRDITSVTNERTVIAAVIPKCGVGHTMPLMMFKKLNPPIWSCIVANLNCLVLDYVARQKVGGTHLTYGYLKQFPILSPSVYTQNDLDFIKSRVLELTYTAHSLKPFAEDMGFNGPPFAWDPKRRTQLRADLDAYYARLYGLTRDELRYILDPSDIMGDDYPSETFRGLKKNELRNFGEYRTQRLVLEAWDSQNQSIAASGDRSCR